MQRRQNGRNRSAANRARGRDRLVLAPEPELMAGQHAPNRVLSAKLKPGEEVEWLWTSILGGRYVSGYQVIKTRHPHGTLPRRAPARRSIPN